MGEIINIDKILNALHITETMTAAEFGCGMGTFAVKLAQRLKKGKVYALDVQEEKLSALKSRVKHEQINNILMILCDLEAPKGSTLQDSSLDIVLIPNVLFQAESKHAIIEEAKRVLKPHGQLLIVDWFEQSPLGPKKNVASPEQIKQIAQSSGLILKNEFSAGAYHYGLLYIKP